MLGKVSRHSRCRLRGSKTASITTNGGRGSSGRSRSRSRQSSGFVALRKRDRSKPDGTRWWRSGEPTPAWTHRSRIAGLTSMKACVIRWTDRSAVRYARLSSRPTLSNGTMCTPCTRTGTLVARAAKRPRMPALLVWVWTTSGLWRRNVATRPRSALMSLSGAIGWTRLGRPTISTRGSTAARISVRVSAPWTSMTE